MASLFGIPTPQEVRLNVNRQLFGNVPQMFGQGAPGAAGALGLAVGRLFGGQGADEMRAAKIQSILGKVSNQLGSPTNEAEMYNFGKTFAQELIGSGEMDMGMNILGKIKGMAPVGEVSPETQTDIRKSIIKGREGIEKEAANMVESMKRITSLGTEAKAGNRSARGVMVQQLARLAQGAGVITDRDAAAVTGDQNGLAFLLSAVMPNVSVDTQAYLRSIDPLGTGFNADNLLNVADMLLTSGRESVNNRLSDLKEQATEARFKPQGIKALFAGSRNVNALNSLSSTGKKQTGGMSDEEYQQRLKDALK